MSDQYSFPGIDGNLDVAATEPFTPIMANAQAPAAPKQNLVSGMAEQAASDFEQMPLAHNAAQSLDFSIDWMQGNGKAYTDEPRFLPTNYDPNFRVPTDMGNPLWQSISDLSPDQQKYIALNSNSDSDWRRLALIARQENRENQRLQSMEDTIGSGAQTAGHILSFAAQIPLYVDAGPMMGLSGGARVLASGIGGGLQAGLPMYLDSNSHVGNSNAVDDAFGILLGGGLAMVHGLKGLAGSRLADLEEPTGHSTQPVQPESVLPPEYGTGVELPLGDSQPPMSVEEGVHKAAEALNVDQTRQLMDQGVISTGDLTSERANAVATQEFHEGTEATVKSAEGTAQSLHEQIMDQLADEGHAESIPPGESLVDLASRLTGDNSGELQAAAKAAQEGWDQTRFPQGQVSLLKAPEASPEATGGSSEAFRKVASDAFGEKSIAALEAAGTMKIVNNEHDLPVAMKKLLDAKKYVLGSAAAMFDKSTGTTYMLADHADPRQAVTYMLHELGEHHGLEQMLGSDHYAGLQQQIRKQVDAGDLSMVRHWNAVKEAYSHLEPGSPDFMREMIANMADKDKLDSSWLDQAKTNVKSWLKNTFGVKLRVTPQDVNTMLGRSLRNVITRAESLSKYDIPHISQADSDILYALKGVGATAKEAGINPEKRLLFQAPATKGGLYGYFVNNASLVLRGTGIPEVDRIGAQYVPSVQGGIDSSATTGRPSMSSLKEQKLHGWATEHGIIKDNTQSKWALARGMNRAKLMLPKVQHDFDEAVHQQLYNGGYKGNGAEAIKEYVDRTRALQKHAFEDAKDNGADGTANVEANDKYARRVFDYKLYDQARKAVGVDGMVSWLAQSMKKAYPDAPIEDLRAMAQAYDGHIMDRMAGASSEQMFGMSVLDTDKLVRFMTENGVDAGKAAEAAERLKATQHVDTNGAVSPLKHRIELHEGQTFNVPGKGEMKLSDLFSHERTYIDGEYFKLVSGASAAAEVGIKSESDHIATKNTALRKLQQSGVAQPNVEQYGKMMDMIWKQTMAKPMSDSEFSQLTKTGRVMSTLTQAATMGMSGLSVLNNVTRTFYNTTWRRYLSNNLRDVFRRGPDGGFAREDLRELEQVVDMGRDHISDHMFHVTASDSTTGKVINGAQLAANRLNKITMTIGGMSPALRLGKMLIAPAVLQRLVDNIFNGENARAVFSSKMWASMNITPEMADRIEAEIRAHAPDVALHGEAARHTLNFGSWTDREARSALLVAVDRMTNTMIHGDDMAAQTAFMNHPVGRLVLQLRRFPMMASSKQFGRLQNQRDKEVIEDLIASTLLGGAAYTARTDLQAMLMPDGPDKDKFMEQRHSDATYLAALIGRSPYSGMFPTLLDTALGMLGANHFFDGTRSSEGSTDLFSSEGIPMVSMLNGIGQVTSIPLKSVQGRMTQHEVRALRRVTPLANTLPGQAAFNRLIQMAPKRTPKDAWGKDRDPYLQQLLGK